MGAFTRMFMADLVESLAKYGLDQRAMELGGQVGGEDFLRRFNELPSTPDEKLR